MSRVATVLLLAVPPSRLPAQQRGLDVQAYHFSIALPDTGSVIRGRASVLFRTGAGYDDTLRLDLIGMSVDSVFDLQSQRPVPFAYDGSVLRIATRRDVVVAYHGAPRDGLVAGTTARGRRAFFGDNWPNRARDWLPTVDTPAAKARVRWSVRAPAGWRVVTNAPQCRGGGPSGAPCQESAPLPTYCMVLGATVMSVSRHRPAVLGSDTVPVEVWAYPEDSAFADSVPFRRATRIVETMMRLVGPFPYARLAHVESSTRYGGMENATAIFYDEHAYVRRTMGESVVRHETAHQWFGDAVTERDWADLWLSEGFASYFDLVVGAALDGDSVLARGLRRDAATWLASRVTDRPVIDTAELDPNRLLNANVYEKGAWVLHMLRELVGDSAFFRGVRAYYRTWRDSSVTTAQFQRAMESVAGRPLDGFFRQWLRQPGCPELDVRWSVDGTRTVTLAVSQVQPATWGRFRIADVPVEFRRAGRVVGRRSFALEPTPQAQVLRFDLDDAPDEVVVDPGGTLLLTARVHG